MMDKYINNTTGEIYTSLWHAIATIIKDWVHYPKCRDLKMFNISKIK